MKTILRSATICMLALTLSGCVIVRYETKTGNKLTYISPAFGTKTFGDLDLENGTLKGARSDQSRMVDALESLAKVR